MGNIRKEFIITRHARERFVQRTDKRFARLQWCEYEPEDEMDALRKTLEELIKNSQRDIDSKIFQRLEQATDSRSFLNNSGFMAWYYEKYGYDKRFQFLVSDDVLFIAIIERGRKIIVTCISSKGHMAGKSVLANLRNKFRKKKDDEDER